MNRKESLKKLKDSNLLLKFVDSMNGTWNHSDWETLCKDIQDKGFIPIDFDNVGLELEKIKEKYWSEKV